MRRKYDRVYQFKIVLKGIEPPIWRRIQVPETYILGSLPPSLHPATHRRFVSWECRLHPNRVGPARATSVEPMLS